MAGRLQESQGGRGSVEGGREWRHASSGHHPSVSEAAEANVWQGSSAAVGAATRKLELRSSPRLRPPRLRWAQARSEALGSGCLGLGVCGLFEWMTIGLLLIRFCLSYLFFDLAIFTPL